ncbi:MAP7 domain-containing protein 1 isoform X6 [Synchiropus splendidus]|uniref:MAP7 domain-containing protein 1 isoform X6 n=1 Tax=Synchiropus splendidus TaxID=270530 RepID=UPI00237EBA81|nr:MAP7 domain-containing protein 1 isoform X6 [Synchiropus splendidus]
MNATSRSGWRPWCAGEPGRRRPGTSWTTGPNAGPGEDRPTEQRSVTSCLRPPLTSQSPSSCPARPPPCTHLSEDPRAERLLPTTTPTTGAGGTCPTAAASPASRRTPAESRPPRVKSNRSRAQSPCSPGQFPPSPRHRATTPDDRAHGAALEKRIPKSTSRDLGAESPGTAAGRSVGGTTDAEEASRLLAERRRLARIQKEQEESRRQEQELRRQQEARELQESQARQAQEERQKREEQRRSREEEERRLKEQRWKDMQEQLEREREEAVLRGQKETERKRMEREQQQVQQEQERLQRRKRIDEIMKRTRRSEAEPPPAAILLGPLDGRSAVDELSDGVQSMDVSPVSRDEQASGQDFSPLTEGGYPLLMDLDQGRAQTSPYPRLGDLNENLLIQMSQVDA